MLKPRRGGSFVKLTSAHSSTGLTIMSPAPPFSPLSRDCPPDRTPFSSRVMHSWFGRHTRRPEIARRKRFASRTDRFIALRRSGHYPRTTWHEFSRPSFMRLLAIVTLHAWGVQTSTVRGFQVFSKNRQIFHNKFYWLLKHVHCTNVKYVH